MDNHSIKEYLVGRINELKQADSFCISKQYNPDATKWMREIAREESYKVTFARQELERALEKANGLYIENEMKAAYEYAMLALLDTGHGNTWEEYKEMQAKK